MKQILLFIICCIASGACYAQVQTDNMLIGGTLGSNVNRPHAPAPSSSTFTVKPVAGKFFSEKWMLGVSGEYRIQHVKSDQHITQNTGNNEIQHYRFANPKSQTLSIGPMARYYQEVIPKVYAFGESSIGYSTVKNQYEFSTYVTNQYGEEKYRSTSDGAVKTQYLYGNISPGIVFFPVTNLGLELKANVINYTHGIGDGLNQDPNTFMLNQNMERNLQVNFTLASTSIGVGYYF
ncbi:hypothetical protein [uncultured Pontibacter sp.]|uniref:hypothetical protein n=1 Tax=uncultured Pontibacter sp. TaxID=453356 RepID=UPI00261BFCC7|nr:hypothetical protein [uncultured Pontibacter sp.]